MVFNRNGIGFNLVATRGIYGRSIEAHRRRSKDDNKIELTEGEKEYVMRKH